MARVYKFIDDSGHELHMVKDPDNKLPVPANRQVIFIGDDRMEVESVKTFGDADVCAMYFVRVRTSVGPN
jgi:hypothetical protein